MGPITSRSLPRKGEATDPTRQDFYQVLERYFRNLANDFKQVIEKRKTA